MYRSYRFRVYPTREQVRRLLAWEGALRFLWNLAHEQRLLGLARPRGERRYPSAFDQHKELTTLRAELPWLADVPRNSCEATLIDLDKAWQRCFGRLSGHPRWKTRRRGSVGIKEAHSTRWRIAGDELFFASARLGPLRIVQHRELAGRRLACTIRRDGDQWFACVVCEVELSEPAPRHEPVVAIDRGIINTADSDGRLIPQPRFYKHSLALLARAQRNVSRKQKGSKNREKAKIRVARLHRKVRRQREHVIHGLSHAYAKSHGTVVVEKLNTQGMVRGNRGIARGIRDSGWGQLVEQLRYKLAWSGGRLVEVPAQYSSQTCSACGTVDAKSRRSQAEFVCTGCGHAEHADLNAAKVLKSRANRSALPVEGTVLEAAQRSRKVRLRTPRTMTSRVRESARDRLHVEAHRLGFDVPARVRLDKLRRPVPTGHPRGWPEGSDSGDP